MGAGAVLDVVARRAAEDGIDVHIVWLPMLPEDTRDAAVALARQSKGLPVRNWWDGDRHVARLVARAIAIRPAEEAWDVYLVYASDAVWKDDAPSPLDWVHQLSGVAPDRLCYGRLGEALEKMAAAWRNRPR